MGDDALELGGMLYILCRIGVRGRHQKLILRRREAARQVVLLSILR
jgi:hypothetical protein